MAGCQDYLDEADGFLRAPGKDGSINTKDLSRLFPKWAPGLLSQYSM